MQHIQQMAEEASAKPASLNEFLCKQLNIYVSANTAWVDRRYWDESIAPFPTDKPESTFVAFDLAHTRDLNAVCTLHRYSEENFYAKFQFFLPEESIELIPNHYKSIFSQAHSTGILRLTPGNVTDLNEIQEYIKQECEKHNVKEIAYDPYNGQQLGEKLEKTGAVAARMAQNQANFNEAIRDFIQLMQEGRLVFSDSNLLRWCANNAIICKDRQDRWMFDKKNSKDKIDPIVAAVMAYRIASLQKERSSGSLYVT
jgi:phage terminase large subunit-like protein